MSQFNAGKASIDLVSDNSDANAKIDQTTKKVEDFKSKGEAGGAGFAKGIKASISAVTSFIGSLTAAIGVATLMYNVGQKIREAFEGGEKAVAKTKASLTGLNFKDVAGSLEAVQKQIADVSAEADAMQNGGIFDRAYEIAAGRGRRVEERLAELRKTEEFLQIKAEREQVQREREEYKRFVERNEAVFKAQREAAQKEQDAKDAELAEAYEQELEHRKYLAKLAEEEHDNEMRRIEEEGEARMEWLRRVADEQARIRREQEAGFGAGNITFNNGGQAAAAALFLRARTGRGNGRF